MIQAGTQVHIRPEYQDSGDDQFFWVAVDNESKGRVTIAALNSPMSITPTHVVRVEWLCEAV
jgi:hypothetical protein